MHFLDFFMHFMPCSIQSACEAVPGDAGNQICPVQGARWQGEWLLETDLLKDLQAEFETASQLAKAAPSSSPPAGREVGCLVKSS